MLIVYFDIFPEVSSTMQLDLERVQYSGRDLYLVGALGFMIVLVILHASLIAVKSAVASLAVVCYVDVSLAKTTGNYYVWILFFS